MKVICVSDKKPGHYNQSKGVLLALEALYSIDVQWLEVDLKAKFLRVIYKYIYNNLGFFSRKWFFEKIYGFELLIDKADFIVSTGGNTAYLNASLKEYFSAKNIFVGGMRGLKPELFNINLVLKSDGQPNQMESFLAPTTINVLPEPEQKEVWMMAIGGDSGEYRFESQDWDALVSLMSQCQQRYGIYWLITTSRRTGKEAEDYIRKRVEEANLNCEAVWYIAEPKPVMHEYLNRADNVCCTEDSFSMLTEAVSSGRKVVALQPQYANGNEFYCWALSRLVDKKYVVSVKVRESLDSYDLYSELEKLSPLSESVFDQLAVDLQKKISGL